MATLNAQRQATVEEQGDGANVVIEVHPGWGSAYVAKLGLPETEQDQKYKVHRDFLRADRMNLSRAGNGSKSYDDLPCGVYEAKGVYRSYASHTVWFAVTVGPTITILADSADGERGLDLALQALAGEAVSA